MFRLLSKYLHHVKRQSSSIREVHALLFATVSTLFFIFLYVYVGGISKTNDAEGVPVASVSYPSPFSLFTTQIREVLGAVKTGRTIEVINKSE